ncbi:hypothetical protein AXY43_16050 [Clostridium sp. MF28]|uniref:hypothetical protein n=1 Tax=Clostridium TaxID=1485 RepID=UPI000CF98470|nr:MULTISPECIES: hypothetical protein [Clostridium]AVK49388.1 hypothetical protein AXY43_16050 [Clostridium sp. MF28]PSM57995.1 hypothetical protein C4L39_09260 [Clostridium diolis]
MNTKNLFKLYYIAWHQRNKTRKYTKFGCLENNLEQYENILLKSDIDKYISNYKHSSYLDIWEKACTQKKDYFLNIFHQNMISIAEYTSNLLFYLSSENIDDFFKYKGADFIFTSDTLEPSPIKTHKNLLLICKKLDLQLYKTILKYIKKNIELAKLNAPIIKSLWDTLNVDSNGKVYLNDDCYVQLKRFSNNPQISDEINDFFNTLIYLEIHNNNKK